MSTPVANILPIFVLSTHAHRCQILGSTPVALMKITAAEQQNIPKSRSNILKDMNVSGTG